MAQGCAKQGALDTKDWGHVHAFVKDSDNVDVLAVGLLVENNMAPLREFTIALSNFVAGFANIRVLGK